MSAEEIKGLRLVDVTQEIGAVAEFMHGASLERKVAVVTWALDFLGRLTPATKQQIVAAAGQVAAQLGGKVVTE